LARLKEKEDRLSDDQHKISFDCGVAMKYKGEIEELQARAVEAAYTVV
jgi:hypothetical protein